MPPPTNIDRPYRTTNPAFVVDKKGKIVRNTASVSRREPDAVAPYLPAGFDLEE